MEGIKEYLLGVISAAVLCSVVTQLAGKGGFLTAAIKLISGIFMLLAVLSPVMTLDLRGPDAFFSDISAQADHITSTAADSTQESISAIIKEQTQAYILDKANSYGAELLVEVSLSDGEIPEPALVNISGNVSPYTRKILSDMIEKDLGIPVEAQIWN